MTEDELEKQFQSVYTHAKVKEFQKQFFDKIHCFCDKPAKVDGIMSEHEINEWVTYGEGEEKKRIQVAFTVDFNGESNETHCNCRLFESRGMVCKHQLFVWHQEGIERVPDRYVLRRWCKNVKRVHTKVRICYDKSSTSIVARRHDNMCNIFNEVADLAEESQEKYDMVMKRVRELKRELMEASVICESNVVSLGDDTGTRKSSFFHLEMELYLLNRARTYLTRKVFDEKGDRRAKERSVLWKKLLRRKGKHLRSHCPTINPRLMRLRRLRLATTSGHKRVL
ncbi:hypothetical protein RHMOL_Rhmol02G0131200 [Rhododendron molle]|uniref:Uncharacterized protein n=1 Tax=Rhododendron molle TaxID=49168 RepID=A0ACC0PQY9_RHOML|nr:hypothetical protein RHMOL_Rhmol02G0131200 [Rhododendron molle]